MTELIETERLYVEELQSIIQVQYARWLCNLLPLFVCFFLFLKKHFFLNRQMLDSLIDGKRLTKVLTVISNYLVALDIGFATDM